MAAVAPDHVGAEAAPGGGWVHAHGVQLGGEAGRERGRRSAADAELGLEEADAAVQLVPLGAQARDLAHDRLRPPVAGAHCAARTHARARSAAR